MITLDRLRPPTAFDPTAAAYKDWLHLNVVDARSGITGLVNLSLHGSPSDPRSRVVAAGLFHVPGIGWVGNLAVGGMDAARVGSASIAVDRAAFAVDHARGTLRASVTLPDDGLRLRVGARATTPAFAVEQPLPLGSGWVSWYVLPRMEVEGSLRVGDRRVDLTGAVAYHDHNWGRWHWGDDFGWDWGCFLVAAHGPAIVLARTSDRLRRRVGDAVVLLRGGAARRTFTGPAVTLTTEGLFSGPVRRVPGAMAALHQDRARPQLPSRVRLRADDGVDRVDVEFGVHGAAQLIAADPVRPGASFIHELVGSFVCRGRCRGLDVGGEGLGVLEYVA